MESQLIEQYLDEFFKELQHTPGTWRPQGITVLAPGHGWKGVEVCKATSLDILSNRTVNNEDAVTPANVTLIAAAPTMLRTLCRTYLTMLVKFRYGQNSTVNSVRISMDATLSDLRNAICNSTRLDGQHVQDTFEHYVTRVYANL